MKIVTRANAIASLKKYIGRDLFQYAKNLGVTVFTPKGTQNKGWRGHVLEFLAGLKTNLSKAPNGLSYEIKSVSFYRVKGLLGPKETMAICMINPEELRRHEFFESHCWAKLKSVIFCAVMWHGKYEPRSELLSVTSLDFLETDELIGEIKGDYDFIRRKLVTGGLASLKGEDGKWIQARTKGKGHGSITRAFYARKGLVREIFKNAS